jgi:hypothetical protein
MFEFLKLLLISAAAGLVAMSLMWIAFWFLGVFEIPAVVGKVLNALHIIQNNQYQEASFSLNGELESQTGIAAVPSILVREDIDNSSDGIEIDQEANPTSAAPDKENSNYASSEA